MTEPIQITLREGSQGLDIAEALFCARNFSATSRNGATMKLARALVEAGAPDGPVEARGADGRLRFTVRSLHAMARFTIAERDRGGICPERFKPAPKTYRERAHSGPDRSTAPAEVDAA